jgi:hypothetical protein
MALDGDFYGNIGNKNQKITKVTTNSSTRNEVMNSDPKKIVQIPGSFFPHSSFTEALWLKFTAKELRASTTAGRGGTLNIGKTGTTFKFLAPETIIESHNHDWQPYESIQSKILQKVLGWKKGIGEGKDIYNNLTQRINKLNGKLPSGQQMSNILTGGFGTETPKWKVDTPLAYTNSQRRQWQFTFQLADARGGIEVIEAVKQLMKYAAPKAEADEIAIRFPWLFEIVTEPAGLLEADYAAMTSIQPSWMSPYIKGRPSRCELTLSFTDMSPLFEKTITQGGIVNVVTNDTAEAKEREKNAATYKGLSIPGPGGSAFDQNKGIR